MQTGTARQKNAYEKYIKRLLDVICAAGALVVFSWLYILVAVLVRIRIGRPVLFRQPRPGMIDPKTGRERIFDLYKFRTMSDERDEKGELLPDEMRLGSFGKKLRATSLDELPEAINILKGDMSVVGPRPQLVRDMVFMTDEQRLRHTARPGLSGLAQVKGRNAIRWEDKLNWDLVYIRDISFWNDVKIVFRTVLQVFARKDMTRSSEEIDLAEDYGDALLKEGRVTKEEYDRLRKRAEDILKKRKANG